MERVNCILHNETYRRVVNQLEQDEEQRPFCRHNMEHFLSVARLMLLFSVSENLPFHQDILYASALLHDLGRAFPNQGLPHALAGLPLSKSLLQVACYTQEEQTQILQAIADHNQKEPTDALGALLQKADRLSRNCFCCSAYSACYWPEFKKNRGIVI